ncbi:MAG: CBS domain-containing protein [Chloroflexi bacterium]|nr:CBS domain-containing protein [Chloroflexota bacterium]
MSLQQELQTEQVSHLDLNEFSRIKVGTSVRDALTQMRAGGYNVCLISDGTRLVGILTDRDVLRKVAVHLGQLDLPVDNVMTPDPVTVSPETSAAEALWLMDDKHIRNLPVIRADGTIVGNMTYRSVISFLAARYPEEVLNRPPVSDHYPRKQEGG